MCTKIFHSSLQANFFKTAFNSNYSIHLGLRVIKSKKKKISSDFKRRIRPIQSSLLKDQRTIRNSRPRITIERIKKKKYQTNKKYNKNKEQ